MGFAFRLCMCKHAPPRGVWRRTLPGIFGENTCPEITSETGFGPKYVMVESDQLTDVYALQYYATRDQSCSFGCKCVDKSPFLLRHLYICCLAWGSSEPPEPSNLRACTLLAVRGGGCELGGSLEQGWLVVWW